LRKALRNTQGPGGCAIRGNSSPSVIKQGGKARLGPALLPSMSMRASSCIARSLHTGRCGEPARLHMVSRVRGTSTFRIGRSDGLRQAGSWRNHRPFGSSVRCPNKQFTKKQADQPPLSVSQNGERIGPLLVSIVARSQDMLRLLPKDRFDYGRLHPHPECIGGRSRRTVPSVRLHLDERY
jgi:hypothetical protein